jgi:predicted nucleotidyltransferase
MATPQDYKAMIATVAGALGRELCEQVAFVGGCTTGLLLTDVYTAQQVRYTEDVDLIVHVVSLADWYDLQEKLRGKGFREKAQADGPICAMYLNDLRVDFMPDDAAILSFTNSWYKDAFREAMTYSIGDGLTIRLAKPEYFVATKLEAYRGRGNNDPLSSRDIEDVLILFDGRPELMNELPYAPNAMRRFIGEQLSALLARADFDYAIHAAANGDAARAVVIVERIERAVSFGKLS